MRRITRTTAVAAIAALPLGLAACGSDDTSSGSEDTSTSASETSSSDMGSEDSSSDESMSEDSSFESSGSAMAGGEPFGPGCEGVPESGAGSFEGMAQDPVATAAGNNDDLSTLVSAVKEADLVDTLNSADGITVFAPTNDAFEAMDQETLDSAMADPSGVLTDVLTHHVVEGELTPEDLAGEHETLAGDTITVEGEGEEFTVGEASVVCGNVQTANATVYIIDGVLMPEM